MSHRLLPQSIYTFKLHRRGSRFPYEPERGTPSAPAVEARAASEASA